MCNDSHNLFHTSVLHEYSFYTNINIRTIFSFHACARILSLDRDIRPDTHYLLVFQEYNFIELGNCADIIQYSCKTQLLRYNTWGIFALTDKNLIS